MKEYENSIKVHKSLLFFESKRKNSLNKNVTAMEDQFLEEIQKEEKLKLLLGN